jgi:hypothetical protein
MGILWEPDITIHWQPNQLGSRALPQCAPDGATGQPPAKSGPWPWWERIGVGIGSKISARQMGSDHAVQSVPQSIGAAHRQWLRDPWNSHRAFLSWLQGDFQLQRICFGSPRLHGSTGIGRPTMLPAGAIATKTRTQYPCDQAFAIKPFLPLRGRPAFGAAWPFASGGFSGAAVFRLCTPRDVE